MILNLIECGQIVSTHGVRGEVRVNPWCDTPKFLLQFKKFYLDNVGTKEISIIASRVANNVVLMKIDGITTVEEAMKYKNTVLYIKREDADIGDRYFIQELIGCTVYHSETKELLGKITDVTQLPANDIWHISKGGKEYLVPAVEQVVANVNVADEVVYINPMKGIFDDED